MQTGETRIRSKAMPPPNTNPMELDHVRVHVSNPFSRLSMATSRTETATEQLVFLLVLYFALATLMNVVIAFF